MVKRKGTAVSTREPVSVASLTDLASRSAAGRARWPGWGVPIRDVLQAYLARVEDGWLPVTWHEGATFEELGFVSVA